MWINHSGEFTDVGSINPRKKGDVSLPIFISVFVDHSLHSTPKRGTHGPQKKPGQVLHSTTPNFAGQKRWAIFKKWLKLAKTWSKNTKTWEKKNWPLGDGSPTRTFSSKILEVWPCFEVWLNFTVVDIGRPSIFFGVAIIFLKTPMICNRFSRTMSFLSFFWNFPSRRTYSTLHVLQAGKKRVAFTNPCRAWLMKLHWKTWWSWYVLTIDHLDPCHQDPLHSSQMHGATQIQDVAHHALDIMFGKVDIHIFIIHGGSFCSRMGCLFTTCGNLGWQVEFSRRVDSWFSCPSKTLTVWTGCHQPPMKNYGSHPLLSPSHVFALIVTIQSPCWNWWNPVKPGTWCRFLNWPKGPKRGQFSKPQSCGGSMSGQSSPNLVDDHLTGLCGYPVFL